MVYVWLQFVGTVQTLEQHYFSSTLWAGVCLAFAITVAELARPLSDRPLARWLPAAVLLAVPLGYEADPHVPSFGWLPLGAILAAAVIVAAVAARGCARLSRPLAAAAATGRRWPRSPAPPWCSRSRPSRLTRSCPIPSRVTRPRPTPPRSAAAGRSTSIATGSPPPCRCSSARPPTAASSS